MKRCLLVMSFIAAFCLPACSNVKEKAMAEQSALAAWQASGMEGSRPETPTLDAIGTTQDVADDWLSAVLGLPPGVGSLLVGAVVMLAGVKGVSIAKNRKAAKK